MRRSPDSGRLKGGERRAFTLPEILITILLLSILFSLGIVFSMGMRQTRKVKDYETAIGLAQQAIDGLRAIPFGTLDDEDAGEFSAETDFNTSGAPGGVADLYEPVFKAGGSTYERKVEVTGVPSPGGPLGTPLKIKFVKVTVKWKTPEGEEPDPYIISTAISDLN